MTNKEFVLNALRTSGRNLATDLQNRSSEMTGTQIYAENDYIPDFIASKSVCNMIERPVGFICKSSEGRVVKLLQPYDSDAYTAEPEELPTKWGVIWSSDPEKALPFITLSTSPYMVDDCCTENGKVYRSTINNNTKSPSEYSIGWTEV